jgi:MFS superfamily sulfate permease-like transporter
LLHTFSHLGVKVEQTGNRVDLRLSGAATFLRLPKLAAAIESVPMDTQLHLHLENLDYIDHACMDLIASTKSLREKAGSALVVEYEQLEQRLHRRTAAVSAQAAA